MTTNIKLITKFTVLACLISVVILPVLAKIFGLIDTGDLEGFGRFAVATTAPIGVLIGGLAVGTATRNSRQSGTE